MLSYPNWYRALCDPTKDGLVGPSEITTSTQVVPKLLKLTWDSFPLYHSRELGWGYLVPGRPLEMAQAQREGLGPFPLKQFLSLCPPRASSSSEMNESKRNRGTITAEEVFHYLNQLPELTADPLEIANHWKVRICFCPRTFKSKCNMVFRQLMRVGKHSPRQAITREK